MEQASVPSLDRYWVWNLRISVDGEEGEGGREGRL